MTQAYDTAYQRYNWPVESVDDLKIAPFHLMATENAVHADKSNLWHMNEIAHLTANDPVLTPTIYQVIDLADSSQVDQATAWWTDRTTSGAEGMVVKPLDFITRTDRGLVVPA